MPMIAEPPARLYSCGILMNGFDPQSPASILETFSFQQYLAFEPFKTPGRQAADALSTVAAHDAAVNFHLLQHMHSVSGPHSHFVGIMGGHSIGRTTAAYRNMANLARFLTSEGFTIVTGGGPGLMEAAHLGAYFSGSSDETWSKVLMKLENVQKDNAIDIIPAPKKHQSATGWAYAYDAAGLHAWYSWADQLKSLADNPGESLAISTWEYGNEPVMPFASAYACYFQNSIRESHLVRESRAGIIYGRGGGGTLREIWQDVEENYYVRSREELTPMVFFDAERYWGDLSTNGTATVDVFGTIIRTLNHAHRRDSFAWEDKIVATTDYQKVLGLLNGHIVPAQRNLASFAKSAQIL